MTATMPDTSAIARAHFMTSLKSPVSRPCESRLVSCETGLRVVFVLVLVPRLEWSPGLTASVQPGGDHQESERSSLSYCTKFGLRL